MIANSDFNHFLQKGHIEGLAPGTPMEVLLTKYGNDNWIVKETEFNGLTYGIIKMGFIEFHIYNEKINGVSYRPDLPFPKKDFKGVQIPWIYQYRSIDEIEAQLSNLNIGNKRFVIKGPLRLLETAGATWFGFEDGEYSFIDTEGGVTFAFDENPTTGISEAVQICRYYNIEKENK